MDEGIRFFHVFSFLMMRDIFFFPLRGLLFSNFPFSSFLTMVAPFWIFRDFTHRALGSSDRSPWIDFFVNFLLFRSGRFLNNEVEAFLAFPPR